MKSQDQTKRFDLALPTVLAILALAHLPLLLNAGLYQDDWLIVPAWGREQALDLGFLVDAGHPLLYTYYRLVWAVGGSVFAFKLAVWLAILLGAWCTLRLAPNLFGLTQYEAFWLTLVVWTYPGYMLWPVVTVGAYVVAFVLFLAGWRVLLYGNGVSSLPRRIVALVLFFMSFSLNGLLVIFYAFVCCHVLTRGATEVTSRRGVAKRIGMLAWRWTRRHPDFLLLPIAYWLWLNTLFPRTLGYAEYYAFKLDAQQWLDGIGGFLRFGAWRPIWQFAATVKRFPILSCLVLSALTLILVFLASLARHRFDEPATYRSPWVLLPSLAIVLCAVIGPYILIGITPNLHFYESRHLMLLGLPLGLCVVVAARFLSRTGITAIGLDVGLAIAVAAAIFVLVQNYTYLEARWARARAAQTHFADLRELREAALILVDDAFFKPDGHQIIDRHDYLGIFEWSGIVDSLWGGQRRVALDRAREPTLVDRLTTDRLAAFSELGYYWIMRNADPAGASCVVSIEPAEPQSTNVEIAVRHIYKRIFARDSVEEFLRGLITVDLWCVVPDVPTDLNKGLGGAGSGKLSKVRSLAPRVRAG